MLIMVPLCLMLDYTFYYSKILRPYYEKHLKINNVSIFMDILLFSIIYAITWPVTTILILCGYILYVVSKKLALIVDDMIDYICKNNGVLENENQK